MELAAGSAMSPSFLDSDARAHGGKKGGGDPRYLLWNSVGFLCDSCKVPEIEIPRAARVYILPGREQLGCFREEPGILPETEKKLRK